MSRGRWALGALGAALCVTVAILVGTSPYRANHGSIDILGPLIAAAFLATGLWAWQREPGNRTGPLMVAIAFAWAGATLIAAQQDGLYMIGFLCFNVPYALLMHLLLSFPSGRLRTPLNRALAGGGYVCAVLFQIPEALVFAPDQTCGCRLPVRGNPLLVHADAGLEDALTAIQTVVSIGALIVAGVVLARRYLGAGATQRHALRPVLGAGVMIVVSLIVTLLADLTDLSDSFENGVDSAGQVAILTIPGLFLIGLARSRFNDLARENEALHAARIAELQASRARIVAAGDAERRRLERDLHDGAQQRLVSLALTLRLARNRADGELAELLGEAAGELQQATDELRELARGIHPAVLTDRGLGAAITTLAGRSAVPVEVAAVPEERLPGPVESTAYFVVAEALTNVARYAQASVASVSVARVNGHVTVEVRDDGVGGADPASGSGLRGLADRVAALDGALDVASPAGAGTVVRARLPCAS